MNLKIRPLTIIYISVFFIFSLLVLVFVATPLVIVFQLKKPKTVLSRKYYNYEEITPSLNHTNTGIVQMNRNILEKEYLSYGNEKTGNLVVITNIFEENLEYECNGLCFCEEEDKERNRRIGPVISPKILQNGLILLLTAVSSAVAYNLAKESFQNSCQHKYSNICEQRLIKSEVEDCQILEERQVEEKGVTEEDEVRIYDCFGHCSKNQHFRRVDKFDDYGRGLYKNFGDCSKLFIKKVITVHLKNLKYNKKYPESLAHRNYAVSFFRRVHLVPFCRENSRFKYMTYGHTKGFGKYQERTYKKTYRFYASACNASSNQNISCKIRRKNS